MNAGQSTYFCYEPINFCYEPINFCYNVQALFDPYGSKELLLQVSNLPSLTYLPQPSILQPSQLMDVLVQAQRQCCLMKRVIDNFEEFALKN